MIAGIYQKITRAENVTVKALDVDGKEFTLTADGMLARAIQHEYDHLDGILWIDNVVDTKSIRFC